GSSADALAAAAETAQAAGLRTLELTRGLRGEARSVGTALAALAASLAPGEGMALLLAGETTVRVRGRGCGGRNLELALAAACGLADVPERCLLAAGSDGVDGSSPAAGAVVDGGTLGRAAARGRDAAAALADNDAWGFFDGLPEAIVTGPTGTNVADLAFVLAAGAVPDFLPAAAALTNRVPSVPSGVLPRAGRRAR
ncbi:MAG TPA: MOFRL family protein, partial [Thermoanaerobaculaceae bacterium]|nr:MOFRL family protein [Thermoanaerobaculaceae bacterium]